MLEKYFANDESSNYKQITLNQESNPGIKTTGGIK